MWCVDDYMMLAAGIMFVFIFGRWSWEDHKAFNERQEWRELCRLRERYKPGLNEELREQARLKELEEKWSK